MDAARPVIQERMNKYSSSEVGFSLQAVCQDRILKLKKDLEQYKSKGNDSMVRWAIYDVTVQMYKFVFSLTEVEISNEEEKRARFKKDNIRRRHNFLPLVVEVIKQMAAQGKLVPAVEKVTIWFLHRLWQIH